MPDQLGARSTFAELLIARRAELRPEDVGLPGGGRRRTPGLRREEVAVLAGVSADYLARLEQGRDSNPSPAVVDALATALRFNDTERAHFGWLALTTSKEARCPSTAFDPKLDQVPPALTAVLDALTPTPAFALGPRANVLAWNDSWEDLVAPLGLLDDPEQVNLAVWAFRHPLARTTITDWPQYADLLADQLARTRLRRPEDESIASTIEFLTTEPEFARRWQPHRLAENLPSLLGLEHPTRGTLTFTVQTLSAENDQQIVIWLPRETAARAPELRLIHPQAANG
ncbi:helix-turn-helix transcriptional regulator [Nocardia rosealba]|uniref:helix-turn-helix transcriptional regulator n=1 Tax=Nocardia TaxID=1817 RepID=UPI001CD9A93F|nr:helix-turn-helix transcriptional regulator [Nocardia rosealba]MCA2206345.1 helix-turn-helix transcriptional regulator [Nocardia rosealba]